MNENNRIERSALRLSALTALGLCAGFITLSGCGSADPVGSEPTGAQSEAATIERTIVRINADGTTTSTHEVITAAEHLEEVALREYLQDPGSHTERSCMPPTCCTPICGDSSCASSDLWVYDATGETGNELCLYDAGSGRATVSLSDFADGSGTWSGKVRSYWPGVSTGFFGGGSDLYCPSTCRQFSSYGSATNANTCEQDADLLTLNGVCNPG